jgi:HAD superfamily hydrolase (TIGR01509 family)
MKPYDAYLFDWDGTLAQTFSVWMRIIRGTLEQYGVRATDKEIVRHLFGRARQGLREYGVPEADFPKIFAGWDATAQAAMESVPLYADAERVLQTLHAKGRQMVVVSSTIRPTLELILKHRGLENTFQFLVPGDEVEHEKPHPEGINFALEKLGVRRDRAVMVGDSEKDIRAANNAGIDSVLFFPKVHEDFHTLAQLQEDNPTYIVHSWQEFLDQLQ